VTIEDPIEFVHEHRNCIVTQREVGVDTENWDIALRNSMRQAPDVILIGEVREKSTMDYAIAFAETGHVSLATTSYRPSPIAYRRLFIRPPGTATP
jgi:twitching motility protein PilU